MSENAQNAMRILHVLCSDLESLNRILIVTYLNELCLDRRNNDERIRAKAHQNEKCIKRCKVVYCIHRGSDNEQ